MQVLKFKVANRLMTLDPAEFIYPLIGFVDPPADCSMKDNLPLLTRLRKDTNPVTNDPVIQQIELGYILPVALTET